MLEMAKLADLESDLKRRYPEAFQDDIARPFTFRCGEGWYAIVGTLCSLLCEANQRTGQAPTHMLSAFEKMGTLRILVTIRNPHANEWIRFAERHATNTCEICGEKGRLLYIDGWQRVRCEPHTLSIRQFEADE
ncbi:hypothetical protein SAMN05216237_4289 [Pseudomonas yamanorum]|nr:hypothetical protein SAMN05216237_4289 [Pseudomonas yamanorum]